MNKSILEKNIMSNNITSFKHHIDKAPISLLKKLLPFICACGSLLMLELMDTKINIETVQNKEYCMRMGLLTENYPIVNYLLPKNCMDESKILRYYVCRGGSNDEIYNLLDNEYYWNHVTNNDIIQGIKNGTISTVIYLKNRINIPINDYKNVNIEKHKLLLKDHNLLDYYINNNLNPELVLNELYERKQQNMIIFKSIIILKTFFIRIRNQIK
jgi:hypothetical protein